MADNCLPEDVNGGKIVPKSRDRAMTEGVSPWSLVNRTFPSPDADAKELVKKMRETMRRSRLGVDVFVVHEDVMRKLRKLADEAYLRPGPIIQGDIFLRGKPVYSRPSDKECIDLARELVSQGKRVAITLSEPYLPDGIEFWLKKESPEGSDGPAETKEVRLPDCKGESEIVGDVGCVGGIGDQTPNFEHHVFRYADNSAFRKAFPPGPPRAD